MENKPIRPNKSLIDSISNSKKQNNELKESFASLLGLLVGAPVIPAHQYAKTVEIQNKQKKEIEDLEQVNIRFLRTICRLLPFLDYRQKWKVLTKSIEQRTKKLKQNNLHEIPEGLSPEMKKNISEAFQCYILNLKMASYIMILRSIEIGVNELYDKSNPPEFNESKGKYKFVNTSIKLNWIEKQKILRGADYRIAKSFIEGRNEAVHEIFEPTDLQIFSAIELVIRLIKKMKK